MDLRGDQPPVDWIEDEYLRLHPDVRQAVELGEFSSGWVHYVLHGRSEGRRLASENPTIQESKTGKKLTRNCLDPWTYLEVTPESGLKPCCNINAIESWSEGSESIAALRDSIGFQEIRDGLISGDLHDACKNCHIRPFVPVEEFNKSLTKESFGRHSMPLRSLRIGVTSACDLRCTYCAVSQPSYKGCSMSLETFDQVIGLLEGQSRDLDLHLNGHGETTFHPNWLSFVGRVVELGFKPTLLSNLARPLDDEEAKCLSDFGVIGVSVDTVDPELLQSIRRKVRLEVIENNLQKIRASGSSTLPKFEISCGIYDQSVMNLEGIEDFCVRNDILKITFWQLVKYPDILGATNVHPIPSLPEEQIRQCIDAFERALISIKSHGIDVNIAGNFLNEWKRDTKMESLSHYPKERELQSSESKASSFHSSVKILSLHVPKSGGTSFAKTLEQIYKSQFLSHYPALQDQGSINLSSKTECVHGHLYIDIYQSIFPNAEFITWLRHPVDRTVSLYHHILKNPDPENDLHKEILLGNLNLLEFSELEWARNQSLHWFGDRNPEDFKFIGFLETSKSSIVKCTAALGWPYVPKFPWKNKNAKSQSLKLSAKDRKFIEGKNREELLWQEKARKIFG